MDVLGSSAAALAAASIVAQQYTPERAQQYLATAKALFDLAEKQLATGDESASLSYCGAPDPQTKLTNCEFKVKSTEVVPLRAATEQIIENIT